MDNIKFNRVIILCIIALFIVSSLVLPIVKATTDTESSNSDETIIKLNLTSQIKETVTTDAGSMFVDLKPDAVKIGLADAQLYGSVKQEQLVDGTTRVYIKWHSIGIPTSQGGNLIETLDSPLTSQVRTEEDKIEPGEVINAQGDLDALIAKFLELKERNNGEEPTRLVEEEDEDDEEGTSSLASTGDTGTSTSAGGDYGGDGLSDSSDFSTNLYTTSWEDCSPRIAQEEGLIYRQAKQVETDESGKVVATGACEDHGGSVSIQKAYGDPCSVVYDYENKKAYEQYQEYGVVDGETITVTTCSNDFTKSYDIYSQNSDCGVRHDFDAGRSIVQEKLYYRNADGEETQITDCIDGSKAYAHYLTDATCSPYIDKVNNTVTLYKRTAYKLGDGTIEYASECRAVDGGTRELFESYCEQKYEHDFTAGQSYYRTRDYYLDDDNNPVYLTECTRSTTTSFPHKYSATGCGVINDDENLQSIVQTSTYIETPDDGEIELKPCGDEGTPVPYTFLGPITKILEITESTTWTVPKGTTSVQVFAVAGGCSGGNGSNWNGGLACCNGGGQNGGTGSPSYTVGWTGMGGGGGAGEQVTQTVLVTPGDTITITIGQSDQDTTFGDLLTARHLYGSLYNGAAGADAGGGPGNGGNGYGTVELAGDTVCGWPWNVNGACKDGSWGSGGIGYGAGGGGGFGPGSPSTTYATAGGKGAPGYMMLTYSVNKYKRGDDTIYIQE